MLKKPALLMFLAISLSLLSPASFATRAAVELQDGRQPVAPRPSAAEGSILSPDIAISELDSDQYAPAIAYNSKHNEYLVVWENDWSDGTKDIYASRVSAGGQVLISIIIASDEKKRTDPSVAYDPVNDRYLVVWSYDFHGDGSDWDIAGRFIPWNGPAISMHEFDICAYTSQQMRPVVVYARTQEEYLVTWTNRVSGGPTTILARRVWADGSGFPGDGFSISSGTENRDYQDVAYNLHNNEYLVTFEVDKSGSGGSRDISGVRLTGAGVVLTGGNPSVMGEFPIAGWPDMEVRPAVAACNQADQYMVAWQSDQGSTNYAIYTRYLNGDAVPGNVYEIDDTSIPEINVDVGCNASGKYYMLAWQSMYISSKYGILGRLAYSDESFGTTIEIMPASWNETRTFAAVGGASSSSLVAWEHQRTGGTNFDIHGRLLLNALYLPVIAK